MEQRVPNALRDKLRGMLIQPNQTMATVAPNLSEGTLIVVGLIVIAGVRVALEVAYTAAGNTVGFAIGGAVIGIGMALGRPTALLPPFPRPPGGAGEVSNFL